MVFSFWFMVLLVKQTVVILILLNFKGVEFTKDFQSAKQLQTINHKP
jgi:hypothetical protein